MKKFISLLLCATMILGTLPAQVFAAPELDFSVEESKEAATENSQGEAVLSATVPDNIPVYDSELGELVYLEDFEDGSTGNGFSNGSNAYIYTSMTVGDDPAGEGDKAALNTASIMTAQVDKPSVTHYDEVTVMAEVYVPSSLGSASGWCRVAFNDAKCDWSTYKITETDKWITVSETVKDIDVHSSGSWIYELSGKNVYFDNYRVYAKYDISGKVRLVDGNTVKTVDAAEGFVAEKPESTGKNAWEGEDGTVYMAGDTIPAGTTVIATKVAEPVAPYDKNLGELVYFEDFEDGSQANSYTTIADDGAYIWTAGNVVDNPNGDGKAFVSTVTYTQFMLYGDFSVKGSEVTLMVDFLNNDGVASNIPVCFMDSWLDPWNYWTNDQVSKTEWTTKSVTKTVDTNLTNANMRFYFGGKGLHVDNVRVYAKYDLVGKVRFIDGYALTLVDANGSCVAGTPSASGTNAWESESGKIYAPGDTVPEGETLTAVYADLEATPDEPEEEEVYAIPVYSEELGELVYLEDFEDGEAGGSYTTLGNNAYIWTAGNVVDNPNGDGKAFVSTVTYTQFMLYGDFSVKGSEVTLMVDFLNNDGVASNIPVCFMDSWLDPWNYWTNDQISKTEWTTKSVTKTIDTNLTSANMRFYFGGKGLHVDNVRIYAKYELVDKVRFVDGNTLTHLDAANGCVAPAPESAGKTAWRGDDGVIYYEGDSVPAGTTVTACYMPATYDSELGELIYFEDFSDGSWSNGYTTGKNAYFYQNGGVEEGKKYGTGMYPSVLEIVDCGVGKANSITLKMDVKKTADSTATGVAIWGNGFEAWPAFSVEDVTADAWTTKTYTFNNVTLNATGATQLCFGFEGLYVDNICIYADADLGNSIRLIDAETKIVELDGDSYTFPAFESAQKNVWVDKDGNQYTSGQTVASSEIAGKTFKSDLVKFDEIVKLNVSANEITTDKGEITITPEIRFVTGETVTDYSVIQYVTDTANASIERNDDGSLTVVGQMNGEVTVTALLPEEITENLESEVTSLEAVITVSGQSDRIVGSTFKVMMFGNSIRAHGSAESMGWHGNWGMAASAEDKDYAHRFIYYMNEKYGDGAAELVTGHTPSGFEVAAANCAEYNEADFVSYVNGFKMYVEEYKPDIVTIQLGENGSGSSSADTYAKIMAQVINGIKESAPDAIIVISTPFWSTDDAAKTVGTYKAAEMCDIEVAPVNTLGQGAWDGSNPNMAFDAPWITDKTTNGVKAHPGDLGMDRIAKMFFDKANISLSASEIIYTTLPSEVVINGENHAITEEEGSITLTASVIPEDSAQEILWSLVSENANSYASITSTGVLTAINNGTVTVRATSRFDNTVYDEVTVEISGQTDPFTVTYDGNASDAAVPSPNTMAKQGFRLDDVNAFASRPGYNFLGWTLVPNGDVVASLDEATTDTTVYAKWALADEWNFDTEGYAENFTFENAFHQKVLDGYLSVTATGTAEGNILSVISPALILDSEDYSTVVIRMQNAEKASDTNLKLIITAGGKDTEYTAAVSTEDFTNYYFDIKDLDATITGFKLVPTNIDCAVNIDRIKFVKASEPEYAEKPAEYSSAYGNLVYFDNFSGEDFENTADIVVLGPGSTVEERMGRMAALNNNNTLGDISLSGIVIKAADGETFRYTDGREMKGTFTVVFEMYNSTDKQYSFYHVVDRNPGGWDSWTGYYTAWSSKKAPAASWTTHTASVDPAGKGAFGFLNSNALGTNIAISSIALYFMPDNAAIFIDDDKKTVIDLTGLSSVTLPEPENEAFTGWKSGNIVYAALDTVNASNLEGMVFTSCAANTAKITYYGVSYEYLLIDGDYSGYVIKDDNYPEWDISLDGTVRKCIGWSTEENSDTPFALISVTTAGVTLYPVWEIIDEALEYEIAVNGESTIELDNVDITYTYEAVFTPDIEYNTVTWSVSDESVATIDENGVLTPVKSGNITVTAKADYYPGKTASIDVAVTYKEGYEPISVSFEGDVKALPEGFEIIPGKTIDLGEYIDMTPNDSAKRFNGWILNGDSSVIYTGETEALSGEDMVFTALTNYDFNFAVPQTVKGYYNHGKWELKDDMLVCIPNGSGQDNFASISGLSVPASRFEAVEYYMDINYTQNGELKQFKENHKGMEFYFSTDSVSNKYHSADVVGFTEDGKYAIIRTGIFDDKWSGTVNAIRNDFLGNDYDFGYNIRYIRFVEKPQMDETVLTIDGIDSPVTGFAPDVTATVSEKYAGIDSVTWSCGTNDSFLASGNFNENTVYTVTVKVSCTDEDEIFNDVVTATLNGKDADISVASDGAILVSYTFEATDAFLEYDAEISGKDVITRAGRSVAYKFVVSNTEVPDKTATWSIDNTEIAVMTAEGKLVAKKNGTLTITAVSNYNPGVSATFDVTIEGLEEKYVAVTFDKGTADEVTGMPESMSVQTGKVTLPDEIPERDGHIFLGWTEGEDSTDVIDSLVADEDVTLVALWGTGVIWDFNNTKDGFAVDSGTLTTSDTYVTASTTGMTDIRLYSPKTDLDPARYNTFVVRMATEKADKADLFYSPDNAGISAGRMLSVNYTSDSLDTWHTLTFDFSSTGQYTGAQKITKFWFDPFDATNTTAYIDYIAVLDNYRTITFDANGGTLPEAYANGVTRTTGTKLSLTEEASLDGYSFLGWSKNEGGKVITSLTVRDNITLYAVYGEKVNSETESIVLDEDEVVLVKSKANTAVSISYTTPDGEKTWNGTTNMNGYAVAELETGVELTNFAVNPESAEAVVCDKSTAEEKASAIPEDSNTTIKVDGVPVGGSDNSGKKQFDYTVEELTKPGTIFPEGNGNESSVAVDFAKGLPVVFGFDEDYEKNLFSEVVALERGYEPESVLSYRIFSKNSGAAVNTEMKLTEIALDAEETKYIVIRARALGFENPNLRLYFTDSDTTAYTKLASVFHTLTDEYAVYIYNMSANKHWNGTVNSIKLAAENNTSGSLDFDWIMFTNEIPEDTTELDKAYDIFEAVVHEDMPFTDLAKNKWSYKEIAQSYKRGFVKGVSETLYAPDASVTLAEAITIAVRLNHIFYGKDEIGNAETGNWYDTYVTAAISAKIIKPNQFDDYNRAATRREVAMIMEAALPSYYLQTINLFDSIPDVEEGSAGEKAIVTLYSAGVLTGNDAEFNFLPENNITREELAAIINRLALPSARKRMYTELERIANRKVYEGSALNGMSLWTCTEDYLKVGADGIGRTRSALNGTDPIALLHTITGRFNGKDVQKIKLGLVWDENAKLTPEIYYTTVSSGSFSWSKRFEGTIGETDENGVTEVVFDVTTQSAFQDEITQLRFDPFDLADTEFGIAYIILE